MEQTNKIKAFLTVLATTTALSSGFAVTWDADGKIQLEKSDKTVIQIEYGKFQGKFSGFNYYLSQFKGQLEQELGTELSRDDFARILDELGYGTDADTKQANKTERTKLLTILKEPVFAENWSVLGRTSRDAIVKEYGNIASGFNKAGSGYTLGQFKGKIEEILEKPISLGAFKSIMEGLGYRGPANGPASVEEYFQTVKARPTQQPVGSDLSQSGATGQHANPPTHQTQSSAQSAPQTTAAQGPQSQQPTQPAAKFDRAAYIAAQIAARKAAQGTQSQPAQQSTQSSAQSAPQPTPTQSSAPPVPQRTQTQSSAQSAPQTTPTAAKFDRAAYIAAQIAARKTAQGTQSQQPTPAAAQGTAPQTPPTQTQSSAQSAPQTTPTQTTAAHGTQTQQPTQPAAKFDRAAYIASQIAARKAAAQGPQSQPAQQPTLTQTTAAQGPQSQPAQQPNLTQTTAAQGPQSQPAQQPNLTQTTADQGPQSQHAQQPNLTQTTAAQGTAPQTPPTQTVAAQGTQSQPAQKPNLNPEEETKILEALYEFGGSSEDKIKSYPFTREEEKKSFINYAHYVISSHEEEHKNANDEDTKKYFEHLKLGAQRFLDHFQPQPGQHQHQASVQTFPDISSEQWDVFSKILHDIGDQTLVINDQNLEQFKSRLSTSGLQLIQEAVLHYLGEFNNWYLQQDQQTKKDYYQANEGAKKLLAYLQQHGQQLHSQQEEEGGYSLFE